MSQQPSWWILHQDIFKRCGWSIFLVTIYLLGQQIYLPNVDIFSATQSLQEVPFLQALSLTTGSQMGLPMILSLGMQPYMTTLIVWQAITSLDLDSMRQMSQKRTGHIQRVLAVLLGSIQALSFVYFMGDSFLPEYIGPTNINITPIVAVIMLVAGSMFTMWLADENSQRGIGGTVTLIIPGLIAGLPTALQRGLGNTTFSLTRQHLVIIAVITVIFIIVAVYLNHAELRLPLQQPMIENRFTDSYLPIRLLISGGMPFMFSMSVFSFPTYLLNGHATITPFEQTLIRWFSFQHWEGIVTYGIIVVVLGFAFGYISLQPVTVSRQLKESGDYFFDIAPGKDTTKFITRHFLYLTIWSSVFLLLIGTTPLIIGLSVKGAANFSQYLGGLLILVTLLESIIEQARALWNKNRYQLF
ncbi:SecY family transport protein [Schleiferilactobacillus perolens]|uniref:SecY family transport protein n=1 Tax=Schleiferilactobacillus perolens TaxID=100468 RepID=UPI002352C3B7|nr:SecY family transport protein [Schleiferilactobacillus perolens]MCI2172286.1 preprotein translocase subunit SecY [Schleiferilactobacillus perolens]